MYENILEILDLDYKPVLLFSVGAVALLGFSIYAFNSYSTPSEISKKPKQNIQIPLNPKGLEKKLTPKLQKSNPNIHHFEYTEFA